jgi:myo-inositol-hexaphosphate 3-phosphohydrolase
MVGATTRSVFDIFARRSVQNAVLWFLVTHNKTIAAVDQSDLVYVLPGDDETYVDLDIHMPVRGKFVSQDGSSFDPTESTHHSLFG